MIRHRFGGILRAARAGILRHRPSRTATRAGGFQSIISEPEVSDPHEHEHRATDDRAGPGHGPGREDAPTEIDRYRRPIINEEEIE
jgi:hypothetical protein